MVVEPADDTGRDKVFDRAAERSDFADATRRHEHVAARRREIDGLDIRSKVFVELLHLEFPLKVRNRTQPLDECRRTGALGKFYNEV